jgi:hypothetical protein
MDAKRTRYADLIECSARVLAFDGLIDAALPDLVSAWTSEAIDLCNGWVSFSPDDRLGSSELPIVDAVIAEVRARADALRREIFDHIHRAAERNTDASRPIDFNRNTANDVATRMREYLAGGRKQRRRPG